MKNKSSFKHIHAKLMLNVGLNIVLAFFGCFFVITSLTTVFKKPFFAIFEPFIMNVFGKSRNEMQQIYYRYIANNIDTILLFICIALIIFFIYMALNKVIRYLRQIESVVHSVVDEQSPAIVLPKELAPIAAELNNAKNILAQKNEQTRIAEQKKNDLVMYLAHDLKTPLTSVMGYLNLLLDSGDISPDMQYQYINVAIDKAKRLNTLIDEFFEITKLNGDAVRFKSKPINLSRMLEQVSDEIYPVLPENNLTCKLDIEPGLTVFGDGEKLARVFENLLKNAVNYSFPNTEISLTAHSMQNEIHVFVQNTGVPLTHEELCTIFERFRRLDNARSSKTGGTGLGLAIAKEIVTLHGGTITAENRINCTVFTVILPKDSNL